MDKLNTGGPAFPFTVFQEGGARINAQGMTIRDYLAAKALPVIMQQNFDHGFDMHPEEVAQDAYLYADAMLQVREK